jgi:hypothetical protein
MTDHRMTRRCLLAAATALAFAGSAGAAEFTMRISHQFPPTHLGRGELPRGERLTEIEFTRLRKRADQHGIET